MKTIISLRTIKDAASMMCITFSLVLACSTMTSCTNDDEDDVCATYERSQTDNRETVIDRNEGQATTHNTYHDNINKNFEKF